MHTYSIKSHSCFKPLQQCRRVSPSFRKPDHSSRNTTTRIKAQMQPSWELLGLFSAGSAALGAIATAGILNAFGRRKGRDSEPSAKRQKLSPPSPVKTQQQAEAATAQLADDDAVLDRELSLSHAAVTEAATAAAATQQQEQDAPGTPDAEASGAGHMPQNDSVVDLQKLQELEQRVADLNALAELGKVYQDSLALSAQLRNLSSFRLQQDKVLGRGSLAVVQEGEYAGDSVAVKLLPIGSVFAEDSRKEACLALCLHHPNIVRVVGVHLVEVEERPFLALVQEAAPGGDLGWQIEDCDFHMGKRGEATLDVSLKLLLDAARGLAYMHEVDVVHGDVKSRNLLVFWEADEEDEQNPEDGGPEQQQPDGQQEQQQQLARSSSVRPPVWGLKWCDFGVSFRAAEAPGGILKTVTGTPGFRAPEVMDVGWGKAADTYAFGVIAWQLLTGEKPIVYDREWRMHMPNPNLLRVSTGSGPDAIPATLVDLVADCGEYSPAKRPSMRQVVQRLEDIATTRLEAEQAAQAAAAAAEAEAAAAAAAEAQKAQAAEAAAAQEQAAAESGRAAAAAAAAAGAGQQVCKLRTGGLARALSQQARDAAAGGAAADLAAAQQQLQHILQHQQHPSPEAAAGAAPAGCAATAAAAAGGAGAPHHHRYEVLIENDDDPITAEAVAHTLEQFEAGSLAAGSLAQVLSGHPYPVQQVSHATAQAAAHGGPAAAAAAAARSLHHSATAPVHSQLLDRAADVAAAAAAAEGAAAAGLPSSRTKSGAVPGTAPLSITGAVSRANIELLPAEGPGLVQHGTPPRGDVVSPRAAAAAAAAAGSSGGGSAAAAGLPGSSSVPAGGWFLASGSSFKKGMWLEKTAVGPAGAAAAGLANVRVPSAAGGALSPQQQQQQPASPVPSSPLSLGAAVAVPDLGTSPHRSAFSLQLRRESQSLLPSVAEDDTAGLGAWQLGAASGAGEATAGAAAAATGDAAAARALRRAQTTRRLGTDVLAAAGALSKALSAFSSASQALPAAAVAGVPSSSPPSDPAAAASSNILLTQDFVAAARGLSEALAALLPSAAALADADPSQGAAAAAAATEAVQGLKSLQGRMATAKAAAAAERRRSSDGSGADAAGSGPNLIPVQRSVTEGQSGGSAMGPPAPVDMSARDAAAAAAAAAGETAFARQQAFAFSPPCSSDAPIHAAALPVPITGPRRSFDGTFRPQLSWTSRARANSAGGGPPAAVADALAAAGSFDSLNMSLPRRSLDDGFFSSSSSRGQDGGSLSAFKQAPAPAGHSQSPKTQQMQAAAGAGEGGVNGTQPAVGSWGASEPVLLRQPSRRRSMEGGRLSLDGHRQQ